MHPPILAQVFSFLNMHDFMQVSLVCKKWNAVASSDHVWKSRFPELTPDEDVPVKEWYRITLKSDLPDNVWLKNETITIPFRKTLIHCSKANYMASYFDQQTRSDHQANISSTLLDEKDGLPRLLTGSLDKTIKIWRLTLDRTVYELSETLEGHQGAITVIKSKGDRIYTGSTDKTIHVWLLNLQTTQHELHQQLVGHEGTVTCIETGLSPRISNLFTGSTDKTIRVWKNHSVQILEGHKGAITCLKLSVDDNRLYSGSTDGTIRVWKEDDEMKWHSIQTIQAHTSPVTDIVYYQYRGIFCSVASNEIAVHSRPGKNRAWSRGTATYKHASKIRRIYLGYFIQKTKALELYLLTDTKLDIVHLKDYVITPTEASYFII